MISEFLFHYVFLLRSTVWTVCDFRISISLSVLTTVHCLDCWRPQSFYFTMCTYCGPLSGLFVYSGFLFHYTYLLRSTVWTVCNLVVLFHYVYFNTRVHCLDCSRPRGFYFTMCTYRGLLSGLFVTSGFLFHYVY